MKPITRQIGATALILLASLLLFVLSSMKLEPIDSRTESYFKQTIAEATIGYGTVRGVNAVVSVLKESELAISPAGIGLTIAAGQILDPIDDMTERLSSVLVLSIVSLGLQKIINEVGAMVSLQAIAVLLPFFIVPLWITNRTIRLVSSLVGRIITLAVILRLLLPISSLVSHSMYQHVFFVKIQESREHLSVISSKYKELSRLEQGEESGGVISRLARKTNIQVEKTKEIYSTILNNAESIVHSLVQLTILYVTLLLSQVILIPLFMLWLLIKIVDTILLTGLLRKFTEYIEGRITHTHDTHTDVRR